METIKDIIAEMREFADIDACTIGRDVLRRRIQHFARRIEKAVERTPTSKESLQVGNMAKMREALENSNGLLEELALAGEWAESAREQIAENKSTLSAPPRNCDKFSKAEVLEMLDDCSFSKEDTIEWLYATKGDEA